MIYIPGNHFDQHFLLLERDITFSKKLLNSSEPICSHCFLNRLIFDQIRVSVGCIARVQTRRTYPFRMFEDRC